MTRTRAATGAITRRLLGEQRGFTLVELMSALLVASIGVFALITTFDSSRALTTSSEQNEVAATIAEQELERLQALSYSKVALQAAPQACDLPCRPDDLAYHVSGGWYRWDQDRTATDPEAPTTVGRCDAVTGLPATHCEPLVIGNAASGVPATRSSFEQAGDSGTRYILELQRFVTWATNQCPGAAATKDCKRITVAIRVTGRDDLPQAEAGPRRPILISTVITDSRMGLGL